MYCNAGLKSSNVDVWKKGYVETEFLERDQRGEIQQEPAEKAAYSPGLSVDIQIK